MRGLIILFLLCNFFMLNAHQNQQPLQKLLIIDTNGDPQYNYRNTMLLAESVGFKVDFLNFYDLLEGKQILPYQNVLIFISSSFIKNLNTDLGLKIIKILEDFCASSNKFFGILLPSASRFTPELLLRCNFIFNKCGIFKGQPQSSEVTKKTQILSQAFLKHILQHDSKIGSLFGTTLLNPKSNDFIPFQFDTQQVSEQKSGKVIAQLLPMNKNFSADITQTLPVGLYIKNQSSGNSYLISKESIFNFADIAENFFKCPIDIKKRNELLMVAQQVLLEIHNLLDPDGLGINIRPSLPKEFTVSFIAQEKNKSQKKMRKRMYTNSNFKWVGKEGISCAWLEVSDFFDDYDQKPKKESQVERGAEILIKAGFNLLWFEFTPECYLSINAKNKLGLDEYKKRIQEIADALKKMARELKKPMPKIFIGTDITTNFGKMPVPSITEDVYGQKYTKIPCPIDIENFWKREVIEVFAKFYQIFNTIIPIDGVFFDFEMYHAQDQAGVYTNQMDFSDLSWELYCKHRKNSDALKLKNAHDRSNYLSEHKEFDSYFAFLTQKAYEIGKLIKQEMHKITPNLLFGAYAITLPSSWFYQGIFAGLSSIDEPLILATFNFDYYSHYQWMIRNNIYVMHAAPIMLSKFKTVSDLSLVNQFLQFHDFVWYNRPSRMIHNNRSGHQWSIEASEIDTNEFVRAIAKALKK